MIAIKEVLQTVSKPRIDFGGGGYVPFYVEWPEYSPANTGYWMIRGEAEAALMVGMDTRDGRIVCIEDPASIEIKRVESDPWSAISLREGHPCVDLSSMPHGETYYTDPYVKDIVWTYTPRSLRMSWGSEVFALHADRCLFGVDSSNRLVLFGIVGISSREHDAMADSLKWRATWRGQRGPV
jgi:hypothetical protein